MVAITLTIAPAAAVDAPGDPAPLTPKEIPNPDRELIAAAHGWTLAEAAAQEHAADVVGEIATRIATERPEISVGSALSEEPGGTPTIYVKGPADAFVRDLVSASDIDIILADKQPYSFEELEARGHRVHIALAAAGFRNILTAADITGGGLIPAEVAVEPGLPTATSVILESIPSDLRGSVVLSVGDASGWQDTWTRGGMWMTKDSGTNWCTSGWVVRKYEGEAFTYGVTTAGHCKGINGIRHGSGGTPHSFTKVEQHRGQWGDIEWGTTSATELATFFVTSSEIRNVMYLEARSAISVNESVCLYGRSSNDQDCSLDVLYKSVECTNDLVWNNRLVMMNGQTSIVGDSGGPWFNGYTAFGSQKGHCGAYDRDTFSVADLYDEALGVEVVIYE